MIRGYDQWKTASPYDDDPACEVCGVDPSDCECPICPVCSEQGNPACDINKGENRMQISWCYWQEGPRVSDWVTHAFERVDHDSADGVRRAVCGAVRPADGWKMAGTSGGECAECLSIIECADPDCEICADDPPSVRAGRNLFSGTQFEEDD